MSEEVDKQAGSAGAGAKPKFKRIVLKTLWVMFSLAVGLTLWVVLWWYDKPSITVDYVAQLNEMRKPADYRLEDDGAGLYLKACSMAVDYGAVEYLLFPPKWPGDMNDVEVGKVKAWVASNEPALAVLKEAMAKKCFWVRRQSPDGSMEKVEYPELNGNRTLARALICRGRLKVWQGDIDGGLADIFTAGDVAKCFGEKPTVVEWLWGTAMADHSRAQCMDTINRVKMTPSQLAKAAAGLETMGARWQEIDAAFDSEQMGFSDFVQRWFSSGGPGGGKMLIGRMYERDLATELEYSGRLSAVYSWGFAGEPHGSGSLGRRFNIACGVIDFAGRAGTKNRTTALYDATISAARACAKHSPSDGTDTYRPVSIVTKEMEANPVVDGFASTLACLLERRNRFQNDCCGSLAAIAVLRYKADKGALPESWEDVVAGGYLKEVPIDLYGAKAFGYRKTADGFEVWSVGEKDERGHKNRVCFWPAKRLDRPGPGPGGVSSEKLEESQQ